MSLNFTEKLRILKMNKDAKFEEEMTCRFKSGVRILENFGPSTQKSQNFAL